MTPEQELAYIAAFIDGEGWIVCQRYSASNRLDRRIGYTNTDKALFDAVTQMLERAGFRVATKLVETKNPKHSNRWNAYLLGGKKTFELFLQTIPLQHPGKLSRLREIVTHYLTLGEAKRVRAEAWRAAVSPERRREIALKMRMARYGEDYVPKNPKRIRCLTDAQKERKNYLKRLRKREKEESELIAP
jgi:hypothetical protein